MNFLQKENAKQKLYAQVVAVKLKRKAKPKLPKVAFHEYLILKAVSEKGDVIGGSFAQKTLYPDARAYQDIDVISNNPYDTAKHITKRLQRIDPSIHIQPGMLGNVSIKDAQGKVYADVVPTQFYKNFVEPTTGILPSRSINGIKVLKEQALFDNRKNAVRYARKGNAKALADVRFLGEM